MLDKNSFEASLMLESQVEVGPKTCHFWKLEITGHFLFLESFVLTLNSSKLMFEMSNETCMDMNEVFLTLSHLQIQQLTLQLIDDLVMHR